MSSTIMQSKPEDLDTVEKRSHFKIAIIGYGQQGTIITWQFAEAGFTINCFDSDQTKINMITKGKSPYTDVEKTRKLKDLMKTGRINITNDLQTAVSKADIILTTIPVKVDGKKKTDYNNIRSTFKQIGATIRQGAIVIVFSIMGIGATETEIKETLENSSGLKAGVEFGLAYSPILLMRQAGSESYSESVDLIAAFDKKSLSIGSTVLEIVYKKQVRPVEQVKMAEAIALFHTARRSVNSALTNELAIFCEKLDINYEEIAGILNGEAIEISGKPNFSDSRLVRETRLLLENAENASARLRISALAEDVNEDLIKHAIALVRDALSTCEKTLNRAKISMLGLTEQPETRRVSKGITKLAQMLETRGAKMRLYDPNLVVDELGDKRANYKHSLAEALDGSDCIVIAVNHEQFRKLNLKKTKLLMKMPAAIVDLVFAIEADKVEKEGFAYKGLGRGVSRK